MNKKKLLMFGLPLLAVVLVSAALLTYFGVITGLVTVSQGLLVDGKSYDTPITENPVTMYSLEAKTITGVHYLENQADVNAEVYLIPSCLATGDSNGCDDINTEYYQTNLRQGTLTLSKKNGSWAPIGPSVIVTYYTNVDNGKFVVNPITTLPADYTLVYYVDKEFMTDTERLLTPGDAYPITVDTYFELPRGEDGNLKGAVNYCTNFIDTYTHCKGAKLWLVPSTELNLDNTLKWSSGWQSAYYFETDLLGWTDTELSNPVIVPAGNELDFVIVSNFPKMMKPAVYTITTTVNA